MEIRFLKPLEYKDYQVPIVYDTDSFYDIEFNYEEDLKITIKKKELSYSYHHEKNDPSERLYQSWLENPKAYGAFENEELIGVIELGDDYSKRLLVNLLWVKEGHRHKGVATSLMDQAKKIMSQNNYRMLILETQSCNTQAISFYRKCGFKLIGFDMTCYSNHDLARHEVRLNFGLINENYR